MYDGVDPVELVAGVIELVVWTAACVELLTFRWSWIVGGVDYGEKIGRRLLPVPRWRESCLEAGWPDRH